MRNFKKLWLFVAISLITAVATSCRSCQQNEWKNNPAVVTGAKPQLVVETGHSSGIQSVAFSPNDKMLASGGADQTVKLWDVTTGIEICTLRGHAGNVQSVAFSPDGKMLASGGWDASVKLWNVATGREIRTLGGTAGIITSVAFSPDGKTLASASADMSAGMTTIKLWDVVAYAGMTPIMPWDIVADTERFTRTIVVTGLVTSLAFSLDGKILASGDRDGTVKLWDTITRIEMHTLEATQSVNVVTFSPDGKMLASGGDGDTIKLWDVFTGTKIRTLKGHRTDVFSIAFSHDGKTLVSCGGKMDYIVPPLESGLPPGVIALTLDRGISGYGTVKLWNVATGTEIRTLERYTGIFTSVAFSSNGKTLASASLNATTIKLWDAATGTEIRKLKGHAENVKSIAFSPDGKKLASWRWGTTIKLWDVATGTEIRTLKGHTKRVTSVAFSPDSKILASGSWDATVKLWDVATGTEIRTLKGHTSNVESVAFNPNGKTLASNDWNGAVKLWDVAIGTEIRTLKRHLKKDDDSVSVTFSPDGKMLASEGLDDYTIRLWDAVTGTKIRMLKGHTTSVVSVAFSPDGKMLASSGSGAATAEPPPRSSLPPDVERVFLYNLDGDTSVKLWNVSTGVEVHTLKEHTTKFNSVVFSPDGKMLAGGGDDNTVRLWDVSTGAEVYRLNGHTQRINSVAFAPDGKTLASGSDDATIRIWDATTGAELASLISFDDDNWVTVTPDGQFTANQIDSIKGLHWLTPDAPLTPLPIEIFMRDYYEPKLLPRVMAREQFKPARDFSTLNRAQPEVKVVEIAPDSVETVQVAVEVANVKSELQKNTAGKLLESGVYDLRLFRDGQLVGYAPANDGKVELNADGKATLKFPHIKLPRTGVEQVEFSAYAFNADRVKSATDRKTYALTPKPAPIKGRAYLIRLGVNAYEREGLNLRYAANDARRVDDLAARLAARGEYAEVVSVPLISDYAVTLADGRTVAAQDATLQQVSEGRKRVTENSATKAHLRAVLDVLAGRQPDAALLKQIPNADKLRAARPEDLVLLSASSHGYTDSDGIFYLVPSDTGTADLKSPEFRRRCVSSDELSRWLREVDAGELVMIVDACHSAAAVAGTDFKPGPMGSRGLGQLSYDKGMRILTATQADNVALEKAGLGLLMRALLLDGLSGWQADYKPRDQSILLTEWLTFGVERVPRLYEELRDGRVRGTFDPRETEEAKRQQPSLFDFARRRREVVLARQP